MLRLIGGEVFELVDGDAVLDEEEGEVADDLGGGGDFDDVAEGAVDIGVHAGDFGPAGAEAHAFGLFAEVGVLAAGHFVEVDIGGAGAGSGVEGGVDGANGFPVIGGAVEGVEGEAGGAGGVVLEGGDDGVEVRLAGGAGHGGEGAIDDIDAGFGGFEDGGGGDAGGVVGVEVEGESDFVFEGFDELEGGVGFQEAGHVLDGEDVGAHFLELFGHPDVVSEGVFVALGVEDVAGVADGGFADAAGAADGLHGDLHVGEPVEGVEDAEDVHAFLGGDFDEAADDVIGVGGVADGVGGAEEHLEADVGDLGAEFAEAFPGILVEEAHGDIEGGAAPHFEGIEAGKLVGGEIGDAEHVVGAHAGGHERLVGVAHGGIGDEEAFLFPGPFGEFFGAEGVEELAGTLGRGFRITGGAFGGADGGGGGASGHFRVAVDDDFAEEIEEAGGAVLACFEAEQGGGVFDEGGGDVAGLEVGVGDDVFEEGDIGFDAADAKFAEGAVHALAGDFEAGPPGGDFDEEGVVVGGDDGAAVGGSAIEAESMAGG